MSALYPYVADSAPIGGVGDSVSQAENAGSIPVTRSPEAEPAQEVRVAIPQIATTSPSAM